MAKNKNKKHRLQVYENSNYTCCICGLFFEHSDNYNGKRALHNGEMYLEIDHINPTSKGGNDTIINKQALCQKCNNIKSDKI